MDIIPLVIAGAMLGLSVGIIFITLGKVAGISGIAAGVFSPERETWKFAFLAGLISSGALLYFLYPASFTVPAVGPLGLIIGGVLVGFGTRIGNGCTCGHGICGNARFSKRSILATLTFIATGAITVFIGGLV